MYELQNNHLDEDDPWSEILEATAFAVQRNYHNILQATIGHLVLERDIILNKPFIADWEAIRPRKKKG